jgi:Raf kinase inhibitor-like YbhB/YbcL family protein
MSDWSLTLPALQRPDWLALDHEYDRFDGCGRNVSPALQWGRAPAGAKSLAVTLFDPDAPTGSGFWHWIAFDLPPTLEGLPSAAGSAAWVELTTGGLQAGNDFGHSGYAGPCPPVGSPPHRYQFRVHALDTNRLGVGVETPHALVRFLIQRHSLVSATVTALYGR